MGAYLDSQVSRPFANVAAPSTDAVVKAAVTGKKLRVLAVYALAGGTATQLTFNTKGGGAGTAISPALQFGVNGGLVLPQNDHGWFETAAGEALTCTAGAGSQVGVQCVVAEV